MFAGVALLGGWGFVGAGLYAWSRRPDRKIGALMMLIGFVWFRRAARPRTTRWCSRWRSLISNIFAAALIHLLLAFPDGELHTRGDRIRCGWATW